MFKWLKIDWVFRRSDFVVVLFTFDIRVSTGSMNDQFDLLILWFIHSKFECITNKTISPIFAFRLSAIWSVDKMKLKQKHSHWIWIETITSTKIYSRFYSFWILFFLRFPFRCVFTGCKRYTVVPSICSPNIYTPADKMVCYNTSSNIVPKREERDCTIINMSHRFLFQFLMMN